MMTGVLERMQADIEALRAEVSALRALVCEGGHERPPQDNYPTLLVWRNRQDGWDARIRRDCKIAMEALERAKDAQGRAGK